MNTKKLMAENIRVKIHRDDENYFQEGGEAKPAARLPKGAKLCLVVLSLFTLSLGYVTYMQQVLIDELSVAYTNKLENVSGDGEAADTRLDALEALLNSLQDEVAAAKKTPEDEKSASEVE